MKPRIARRTALAAYFALMALLLTWHTWWYPSLYFPTALVLTVTAVPLLLPLRGLLYGRPKAYLGTAFLSMLYVLHGTMEAVANPPQRLPALLELALGLLLFAAATLFARWQGTEEAG